jgi:hypothetical protein
MIVSHENLTEQLIPLHDDFLDDIKNKWLASAQPYVKAKDCVPILNEWFCSTKVNDLHGLKNFPYIDITMGNTHFIESVVAKYGFDGFQILEEEYAYYSFMGKWGTQVGNLERNKPLIITLPHYTWGGIRPEWTDVLKECEEKNIDIHIDMAWLTLSKGIEIDFNHPSISSVGMSISKYSMQWNRIGLRWCKQRTMDSITMFNHYYSSNTNGNLSSCGAYAVQNIPRDYGWTTYAKKYVEICNNLNVKPTKLIHVIHKGDDNKSFGVSNLLRYGKF